MVHYLQHYNYLNNEDQLGVVPILKLKLQGFYVECV